MQKALRRPSKEKKLDIVIDPVHDKQKLGPPGERTRIQEAMPPESVSTIIVFETISYYFVDISH